MRIAIHGAVATQRCEPLEAAAKVGPHPTHTDGKHEVTLRLVSHPLPSAWDSREVKWGRWQSSGHITICGPGVKDSRCDCGSTRKPFTAVGLRAADPGPGRFVRRHALRDLHVFRCPDCGQVDVWDMASGEWWTLDESDYGAEGSTPPPEWSGGLFDLLHESTDLDHTDGSAKQ